MLQAHALVPEGAGGGSVYRRPRAPAGPPVPDTSYTLPAGTPLAAAVAGTGAERAPQAAAAALTAAAGAPVSGSDMELTGPNAAEQQQQQQQQQAHRQQAKRQCDMGLRTEPTQQVQHAQCRQPLRPAAGRVAHAAAGPAPRPASAESQAQLAPRQQQQQQEQERRRASVAPAPSGADAGAGGSRRMSAPPAPVDRELHFTSASTAEGRGHAILAAVPEEAPLSAEQKVNGPPPREQQQQPSAQGAAGVQPPPFEFPQMPAPAASELTAPAAAAGAHAGAPTPASVPAPPRHLAITALTGLTATPVKGGIFQYHDPRSCFTFELGPAPPNSAGSVSGAAALCSAAMEGCGSSACLLASLLSAATSLVRRSAALLWLAHAQRQFSSHFTAADLGDEGPLWRYRPVHLGAAAALLPPHFHEEISFAESQVGGTARASLCNHSREARARDILVQLPGNEGMWLQALPLLRPVQKPSGPSDARVLRSTPACFPAPAEAKLLPADDAQPEPSEPWGAGTALTL